MKTTKNTQYDVAIIGAGPAGLLLAANIAIRGLSVIVLDKQAFLAWKNNYCAWQEQFLMEDHHPTIQKLMIDSLDRIWPLISIQNDSKKLVLKEQYLKLDQKKIQQKLFALLQQHNVPLVPHHVDRIIHSVEGAQIQVDGQSIFSRLVIAANGANSQFVTKKQSPIKGQQIAYGQLLRTTNMQQRLDTAVLMDWRTVSEQRKDIASFLYVLPLHKDSIFVEETVLATQKQVDWSLLKQRLEKRKQILGLEEAEVIEEEFCQIEMGGGLPVEQPTIAFGAAAGFVHPVTGYQVAEAFSKANVLAQHLADNWEKPLSTLQKEAWDIVCSTQKRTVHKYYLFGLSILLTSSQSFLAMFFAQFFQIDQKLRKAFLFQAASVSTVQKTMWTFFAHLKPKQRYQFSLQMMKYPTLLWKKTDPPRRNHDRSTA